MTLGDRLKALRLELGLAQVVVGGQGFTSAPGWIKLENGQRMPSEAMIEGLLRWLVDDRYIKAAQVAPLRRELLTLKYLASNQPFLRQLAREEAAGTPEGKLLLAAFDEAAKQPRKRRRGCPPGMLAGKGARW